MGRKRFLLIFFLIIFLVISLTIPNFVLAHPGNVSSDGCHFCKSNCESWGYTYETRHGHHGEICDPSKGPIDPLYAGYAVPQTPPQIIAPTATPTLRPHSTNTPTTRPTLIPIPTATPTLEPTVTPTEVPSPTLSPIPEVKGEATQPVQQFIFRWWKLTPLTTFLALILGWK